LDVFRLDEMRKADRTNGFYFLKLERLHLKEHSEEGNII
jgi:hypothetical protein